MRHFKSNYSALQKTVFVLIAILGVTYIYYTWRSTEKDKFDQTRLIARSFVASLPIDDLKALEAIPGDIDKPQYRVIKNALKEIISVNTTARFAYILTERNDKIFYIADSEPEESKAYSPPGQEHTEDKLVVRQPFKDGKEQFEVSITDRWGIWTSVLIPVKDKVTGKTIAVFGMDFNAKWWFNSLFIEVIESSVLILLILVALVLLYLNKTKNKILNDDIVKLLHTEDELKQQKEEFEMIFNLVPAQIWYKDIHNNFIRANRLACNCVGLPENEINGRSAEEIFPSFAHKYFEDDLEVFNSRKPKLEIIEQVNTNAGELKWVHTDKFPVFGNKGELLGLVAFVLDITERKRAEEKLIIANKELIFQNDEKQKRAAELIIANKKLTFQNDEKQKRAEELIIANKELIFQNDEKQKRAEELIIANKELTFQNDEKGKRAEELTIAKEQAEESDRLKSAFLANMSHEIRTPMNGILGFAGLLKEPKLTGEEQQEYIGIIEQSGTRMLSIINDIVSISKVESGQMEVSIKETNINEQIEYIYTFFKPEAGKKGIQLNFKNSLPSKKSIIKTDREKIYAILTNLVKNALKFTHVGTIEFGYNLKSNSEPVELEFYVKDTGVGINPEHQKFIFERFRQSHESLNRKYEGAGLGLTISRAYVEMLGGKIWVESEAGKGSTFYFTIPHNREARKDKITLYDKSVDPVEDQTNNLKILIAEDDKITEKFITSIVKMFSKEILIAKTGTEAVIACRNNPNIDLILMDIKMPEMDGYEATRQIRQFNTDVLIIAQTAFALKGDREKALAAGCNDYIPKPFSIAILKSLMRKHFYKSTIN